MKVMDWRFWGLFLVFSHVLVTGGQAQALQQEIDSLLDSGSSASNTWGVLIQSDDGMMTYYQRNKGLELTPASNTKLVTTAGAFGLLGEDHAFETRVYLEGTLSGGALTGNVNLVVEHDLTWNTYCLNTADEALDYLADQLKAQGLDSVSGSVNVYGAAFYNRGQFDDVRFSAPNYDNATVASNFRTSLAQAGISVSGGSSGRTGFSAPGTLFHTHYSSDLLYDNEEGTHAGLEEMPLTLATACIELNRVSHNAMADGLLMHVGYRESGQSTLDAGAAAILDWLEIEAGIDTLDLVYGDGSGLARGADSRPGNEFTAIFFVRLVRYMIEHHAGWDTTLSIGCEDGTIGSRYCSPPNLQGRVHAKTGTLFTTIALSGYLDHPFYGERIYFSFLANNSGGIDSTGARDTIEDVIVSVANGFSPITPALSHVTGSQAGTSVEVHAVQRFSDPVPVEVRYSINDSGFGNYASIPLAEPYIIETRSGQQNVSDYSEVQGAWENTSANTEAPGATGSGGGRWAVPHDAGGPDIARFAPSGLAAGRYEVDVSTYGDFLSDNAHQITVRLNDVNGLRERRMDLSFETTGNVWAPVGIVDFEPDQGHYVEFDNSTQSNVTNDTLNSRMAMSAVRFVPTTLSTEIAGLSPGDRIDVRLEAGAANPSDTYSTRPGAGGRRILLVDGNDRWDTQSENSTGLSHEFVTRIAAALRGEAVDSAENDAVIRGDVDLADYALVVYLLGEESTVDECFSDAEQTLVESYLAAGGKVIVSGAEAGWDLEARGTASDTAFFQDVLRSDYVLDATTASTENVDAVAGDIFAGVTGIDYSAGPLTIGYPDVLAGINGSRVVLEYAGKSEGAAVAWKETGPGVIVFGFPITMVSSASTREDLLSACVDYLLGDEAGVSAWMVF